MFYYNQRLCLYFLTLGTHLLTMGVTVKVLMVCCLLLLLVAPQSSLAATQPAYANRRLGLYYFDDIIFPVGSRADIEIDVKSI